MRTSHPADVTCTLPSDAHPSHMSPRRYTAEQAKGIFEVDWPLFGELSRALALRVARAYDPEVVIGVATAGVVPGAVVAAILDRPFHAMTVSRRFKAETVRATPAVFGAPPHEVRGPRVHNVDQTCDSRATLRHALATESAIVLPWDREVLVNGELVPNPAYEGMLG